MPFSAFSGASSSRASASTRSDGATAVSSSRNPTVSTPPLSSCFDTWTDPFPVPTLTCTTVTQSGSLGAGLVDAPLHPHPVTVALISPESPLQGVVPVGQEVLA
eukprot:CAMPEP_0172468334 /NCGR_PEP_ID=MMETSP1065-20121228/61017_1 /TAXON_ID=265537 /ORGANISM="Amphiprora paludosa, Strain CCMP125" /LENGTH=103 /DNA_ID=CAMNT_0013225699 /DNA_START=14 /DNA_END=321 /DNA_ORIENTATION=-